jgi:hypothetical protein
MWTRLRANVLRDVKNLRVTAVVIALLGLLVGQACTSMSVKSPTADEATYIASGYYMLRTGDCSFNSGHPVFLQMLMAVPLLMMELEIPQHDRPFFELGEYSVTEHWRHSVDFLYQLNRDRVEQIVFCARLVVVLLSLVLAIYVFVWSKELYGTRAGLFALFLYTFSPNILAHSRLATLDLGLTTFIFVSTYYYRKLIIRPESKHLILAGLFLGLTLLSKAAAIYLIPVYCLYLVLVVKGQTQGWSFLANRLPKRWWGGVTSFLLSLFGVLIIAWFVVNLGYGFQGTFNPLSNYLSLAAGRSARLVGALEPFGALPVPFPTWFVQMFGFQFFHEQQGHLTFLLGQRSPKGWWYYYVVAFMMKVPIPILLLLIAFVIHILRARADKRFSMDEYILAIPVTSTFLVFSFLGVQNGLRQILPVFPFIFVFLSRLATFNVRRRKLVALAFALLCSCYVVSSLSIYPHYLAYFNELIGGPNNGYKYLVDSNLDWGQDLKGLEKYVVDNGMTKVKLSYFGSADPSFYGIDYEYLLSKPGLEEACEPTHGTIAISATNLQMLLPECYRWLRQYEPVDKIGYSIFVYEVAP